MGKDDEADLGLFSRRLMNAISRLEEQHTEMTLRQFHHLLYVAENPGTTVRETCRALGTSSSVASRNLALLTDVGSPGQKGLAYVEMRNDPDDRRVRRLHLTTKGVRVLQDIRRDLGMK